METPEHRIGQRMIYRGCVENKQKRKRGSRAMLRCPSLVAMVSIQDLDQEAFLISVSMMPL